MLDTAMMEDDTPCYGMQIWAKKNNDVGSFKVCGQGHSVHWWNKASCMLNQKELISNRHNAGYSNNGR